MIKFLNVTEPIKNEKIVIREKTERDFNNVYSLISACSVRCCFYLRYLLMNCVELKTRILSLTNQINQIDSQIDDLKQQPNTREIQEKINMLEEEKYNLERDRSYLSVKYKKNCQ
jgi:cell division protein FtsB